MSVTVNAEGQIYLQDTEVTLENLGPRLVAITNNNPETRIFVRGDRAIPYGRVMEVMGTVNAAGFAKVALVTEAMPEAASKRKKKSAK